MDSITGEALTSAWDGLGDSWRFVVGLILLSSFVFGSLSKTAAKIPGALGAVARNWQQYRDEAAARDKKLNEAEADELRREIKRIGARVDVLENTVGVQHAYIVYTQSERRRIELWAAENGHVLPPPPFVWFSSWDRKSPLPIHDGDGVGG